MIDRKTKRPAEKSKALPKPEQPPNTARTPKGGHPCGSTDEGSGRTMRRGEPDFDPNVNQRPR
jgi:hypothetical protein